MHAFLLVAAVALAGQVTNASGTRYGPATAAADSSNTGNPATTLEEARPLQSWTNQAQPFENARSETAPAATDANATIKPSQLIRNLLEPPPNGQLAGTPLSLAEAVQGANTRSEQTACVEAYWELSAAIADYYLSLRETTDHEALRRSVTHPSPQWEQAKQTLDARVLAARHTAQAAQARLQRMLGKSDRSTLPLPSDVPHCGAYDSRYDEIFAVRPASLEAQQLHKLLPLCHQDLHRQASSLAAAYQWLQTVSQRRDPKTDGSGLLRAHELLVLRRRAFVYAVQSYNISIARYAELASPGEVSTGRLVAMLIHTDAKQNAAWNRQGIRRTSAEEPLESVGPPRTFAEGRQRVETPRAGNERSILAQPRAR